MKRRINSLLHSLWSECKNHKCGTLTCAKGVINIQERVTSYNNTSIWMCVWGKMAQTSKYIPIPFSKYEIYVQLMSKLFRIKRPDNQCEFFLVLARISLNSRTFNSQWRHHGGVQGRQGCPNTSPIVSPCFSHCYSLWQRVVSWTTCRMRNQLGFACLMDHRASK